MPGIPKLTAFLVLALLSAAKAQNFGIIEIIPADDSATPQEFAAIKQALTIANDVKNSDCFFDFMSARGLINTNGRSAAQVAAHLRSISGTVPVSFYFRCSAGSANCSSPTFAVAYRQPPDPAIFFNRAYYDVKSADFDIYQLAGTLSHEALGHSLGGYDHSYEWTPDRDFSVPYSIGGASRENADAFQHCRRALGFD